MRKITVTIIETITEPYIASENLCTHEVPTDKMEPDYNGKEKVVFERTFAVVEVTRERTRTVNLLTQEIVNAENFDFDRVVLAINNIGNV